MKAIFTTIENIDTDQIIPARFLKKTSKEGFGEEMFYDWRFNPDGSIKEDSVFATYEGTAKEEKPQVLVAGRNFGCGSSREHAAWAIADYGFSAVVSSFFADIFRNNALNNMLLPVQVSEEFLQKTFAELKGNPAAEIEIDLKNRIVALVEKGANGAATVIAQEVFPIGEYKQNCLLNRQRDIDFLVSTKGIIEKHEQEKS